MIRILRGDCREMLKTLPDESVHCIVTSPPYWGLRDYGTAKWEGGDPACAHRVGGQVEDAKAPGAITTGQRPGVDATQCRTCGARRVDSQLGLEATPQAYVDGMVAVFAEARRVLRADGTLWLNLGDSYAGSGRGGHVSNTSTLDGSIEHEQECRKARGSQLAPGFHAAAAAAGAIGRAWVPPPGGLKTKDLVGIPWRVAFALQADGWYLRQDIIWAKPNPMPESVRDRCTKSHEYIFLLSKSERYHYDAEAIAEPSVTEDLRRPYGSQGANELDPRGKQGEGKLRTNGKHSTMPRQSSGHRIVENTARARAEGANHDNPFGETRNKRSVWTVTTQPFSEAHFATFPPALIEPCILAGCPAGGVVLDPFGGAGTTGLVADRHGRDAILIELNPDYAAMAERRIRGDAPLFAEVSA